MSFQDWKNSLFFFSYAAILLIFVFLPDPIISYTWVMTPDFGLERVIEIQYPNIVRQLIEFEPFISIPFFIIGLTILFYLGWMSLPVKKKSKKSENFKVKCPKCDHEIIPEVIADYTTCPSCGNKFLTCYPNCDFPDKDGYYCVGFCPYAPHEDVGENEYDFD
jgi:hypothetical protein